MQDSLVLVREGVLGVDSVLVRRRALIALADVGGDSMAISGGTFSLFPSPSTQFADVRGRFGFGVGSGVGGATILSVREVGVVSG